MPCVSRRKAQSPHAEPDDCRDHPISMMGNPATGGVQSAIQANVDPGRHRHSRIPTERQYPIAMPLAFPARPRHPTGMQAETDLETVLLGPVLPDRACGDCTMCCTVLTVDTPDFQKPPGTPCVHLASHGCSIHAERPHICRTWFCAWRRIAAMPDEARPDRSGILVSLDFVREPRNCFEGVSIMVRMHPDSGAIDNAMAGAILDSVCDRLVPVWFSDGSRKMLMHPDDSVATLVMSGDTAPPHLKEEVAAWREQYAVFTTGGDR